MNASIQRRRQSLLAGGSVLIGTLLASGSIVLAPGAARAANECGPVAGASADNLACSGTQAAIVYPSTDGNLTLRLIDGVTATSGGLQVTGSGTNTVTVSLSGSTAGQGDPSLTNTAGAGIGITAGGRINVDVNASDAGDGPAHISGTTAGVRLNSTGDSVTFNGSGDISASAGAGLDLSSSFDTTATGVSAQLNEADVTGSTYAVRLVVSGATSGIGFTVRDSDVTAGASGAVYAQAASGRILMTHAGGTIDGTITMITSGEGVLSVGQGITGSPLWRFTGTSNLNAGTTTVSNTARGTIATYGTAAINFGAGTDTFTNAGVLVVDSEGEEVGSTLTLQNLETFTNEGRVLLGSNADFTATDGFGGDRLVASGPSFGTPSDYVGSGDSAFHMDVDFGADQLSCTIAPIPSDCVVMQSVNIGGSTRITVNSLGDVLDTAASEIVLVQGSAGSVFGGTTVLDPAAFSLDPATEGYVETDDAQGIVRGMVLYGFGFMEGRLSYGLTALGPSGKSFEFPRIAQAVAEPFRTATGAWYDRQVDLRDTLKRGDGFAPGVWLKVAGNATQQDRIDQLALGSGSIRYNTSAEQKTLAVVGGFDLVRAYGDDSAFVFGVTAGKLDSTLEYRAATSDLEMDGYSFGAYGTMMAGGLYIDGIVNSGQFDLTHNDFGAVYETTANFLGAQVEGGYRLWSMNEGEAYFEPLATLSYVRTTVDDLTVGPVSAEFEDGASLRGAIGARAAGVVPMSGFSTQLSLTGRVWKEFEGGQTARLTAAAFGNADINSAPVETLGDVGLGVGFFSDSGRVSATLNYGLKFGDDYQSSDASVSLRLAW